MQAMFQPRLVGVELEDLAQFLAPHAAAWNVVFATTQLAIGAGLVFRRTVQVALIGSFGWAVGVWAVGEGLGGLLAPVMGSILAGFPGPALLYGIVGLVAWPTGRSEQETVASAGLLGEPWTRRIWAVLWIGAAVEQVRPGLSPMAVTTSVIAMNIPGEPSWLVQLDKLAITFTKSFGDPLALLLALAEVTVGIMVLRQHQVKTFLRVAIVLSCLVWVIWQNFGDILAGGATDPGAGPLYVLLALSLYPRRSTGSGSPEGSSPAHEPSTALLELLGEVFPERSRPGRLR